MNLERMLDQYGRSTDTKVAHKDWRAAEREYDLFLDYLAQNGEATVTAEALRQGLMMLHKAHSLQMEAMVNLLMTDRPPER